MMKNCKKITNLIRKISYKTALFMSAVVLLCGFSHSVEAAKIKDLRIGQGVGSSRIVFDADSDFRYNISILDNPKRIIVDVKGIDIAESVRNKDMPTKMPT